MVLPLAILSCHHVWYCPSPAVSSHDLGGELHSAQHLHLLAGMAYSQALERVAIGGGSIVKVGQFLGQHASLGRASDTMCACRSPQVLDVGAKVQELHMEALEVPPGQLVDSLAWSRNGQVGPGCGSAKHVYGGLGLGSWTVHSPQHCVRESPM